MNKFTYYSLLSASLLLTTHLTGYTFQSTGTSPPKNYTLFDLPWTALHLVEKYLPENPVILEAGAFDGRESCTLAKHWPTGHVHSFEPVSTLYALVVQNTKDTPNISTYNLALGDICGTQRMFLSNEPTNSDLVSMSSSLYQPKHHLFFSTTEFQAEEIVDITTIDHWAEENGVEKVDLLWLDMQGYELPALKAAPKILQTVSVILTELEFVEAYKGQALYYEVRTWLEAQGFVLIAGNFKFPQNRDQWFGDGIFVRRELLNK